MARDVGELDEVPELRFVAPERRARLALSGESTLAQVTIRLPGAP